MSYEYFKEMKKLGWDKERHLYDTGKFLNAITRLQEKHGKRNALDKYLMKNKGIIGQRFISPDISARYFDMVADYETLSIAYGWTYGGVVIDYDADMFEAVVASEPINEIPKAWVDMIPGWTVCFLVEKPVVDNGFVFPDDAEFGIFLSRRIIEGQDSLILSYPTRDGIPQAIMYRLVDSKDGFVSLDTWGAPGDEIIAVYLHTIVAMLFTFSLIPHNPTYPIAPTPHRKAKIPTYHLNPLAKPKTVSVRNEQKSYLRMYDSHETHEPQNGRKAHMRRAHWRSVWLGPRDGEQHKELRWIPPTFVRGFKAE